MLRQHGVESFEVAFFLVVHVLHEGSKVRVFRDEQGSLRGIDEGGGKLAGLVHAELHSRHLLVFGKIPFVPPFQGVWGRIRGVGDAMATYGGGEEIALLLCECLALGSILLLRIDRAGALEGRCG